MAKSQHPSLSSERPIIPQLDRNEYPDGILDYIRDEILYNESYDVQKHFEMEFFEFNISIIDVKLNISPVHVYSIHIDFTEYPKIPMITLGSDLVGNLKDIFSTNENISIDRVSYILNHWDEKKPAKIVELCYELEKILTHYRYQGKLNPTQDIPEYINLTMEQLNEGEAIPLFIGKPDPDYFPIFEPETILDIVQEPEDEVISESGLEIISEPEPEIVQEMEPESEEGFVKEREHNLDESSIKRDKSEPMSHSSEDNGWQDAMGRAKCPKCNNVESHKIREVPDRNHVIMSYPLMYGKKYVCGVCGNEWKRKHD